MADTIESLLKEAQFLVDSCLESGRGQAYLLAIELLASTKRETALKAELLEIVEAQRKDVIEEICTQYYGEIIKNFRKVQKSGEHGRHIHENDVKLYEKLIRELRREEWVKPLPTKQETKT